MFTRISELFDFDESEKVILQQKLDEFNSWSSHLGIFNIIDVIAEFPNKNYSRISIIEHVITRLSDEEKKQVLPGIFEWAAAKGALDCIKLLYDQVNIQELCTLERPPLRHAAMCGHLDVVAYLALEKPVHENALQEAIDGALDGNQYKTFQSLILVYYKNIVQKKTLTEREKKTLYVEFSMEERQKLYLYFIIKENVSENASRYVLEKLEALAAVESTVQLIKGELSNPNSLFHKLPTDLRIDIAALVGDTNPDKIEKIKDDYREVAYSTFTKLSQN